MVAGTEFQGKVALFRQTRGRVRIPLLVDVWYTQLDQTDLSKAFYINGGNPDRAGVTFPVRGPEKIINPGEYLVVQGNFTTPTGVGFDNTGAQANTNIHIAVLAKDLNTGRKYPRVLVVADRNKDLLADTPTIVGSVYQDVLVWQAPQGEAWQLLGEFRFTSASTA